MEIQYNYIWLINVNGIHLLNLISDKVASKHLKSHESRCTRDLIRLYNCANVDFIFLTSRLFLCDFQIYKTR